MKREVLDAQERAGLTIWGEAISAQVREGKLAIHIRADAPRDVDGLALLGPDDVAKLRALIDEAEEV